MNSRTGIWSRAVTAVLLLLFATVFVFAIAGTAIAQSPNVTLTVHDSGDNALDDVKVYYNDYGNHWLLLGTTTGGNPVTATFADGSYNFRAY